MFIIWYFLSSLIYMLILILNYFFFKILKFNNNFFKVIFDKINVYFNFYDNLNTYNGTEKISQKINFKSLFNEFTFTNVNKDSFQKYLITTNLNQKLINSKQYLVEINYLINTLTSNIKTSNFKKVNLNIVVPSVKLKLNSNLNRINGIYSKTKINYFDSLTTSVVKLVGNLENTVTNSWIIKYSPSNFMKYISIFNTYAYNILYLRKNKVFNKGRYSRNRQYYRTGVYWCLYVNIIAVVGIYFWFYRFTMNFGYLWWLLFIFVASFIVPKTIKFRLYNLKTLVNSLYKDLLWISYIYLSVVNAIKYNINLFYSLWLKSYYINYNFFNITAQINLFQRFLIIVFLGIGKGLSTSRFGIYNWEYNNINYYIISIVKSRPVMVERIRLSIVQYFLFSFSTN